MQYHSDSCTYDKEYDNIMSMKRNAFIIPIIPILLFSCSQPQHPFGHYEIMDAPDKISEAAYQFAELYEQSDTEYAWGGQDPLRAIQVDCSGLVVMCYKYALVDTKYSLLVSDMTAAYMYENAATPIEQKDLKRGNLIFMGEEDSANISHIAIFDRTENGNIYFIDSTQKDTDNDGIDDINGVTTRCYPENDKRFKGFGRMRVKFLP